jgi:hypothetical protein
MQKKTPANESYKNTLKHLGGYGIYVEQKGTHLNNREVTEYT